MKKYLALLILLVNSYNSMAQESVSISGSTFVEVGVPYNYTFTFNPVYPQDSYGVPADKCIITSWIVSTGTNGGGTSAATTGYIGTTSNQSNYYNNGTYDNVNPLTIPIQWGDATFLRSDIVTVKVSGIYRNSNTGANVGYFNYVTEELTIDNVNRIVTPNISGPPIIGSCGDQTTANYSISNQTYASNFNWSVSGGAQISGPTTGTSITVIPPPAPLSGNYTVSCIARVSGGNPLYKVTGTRNVSRAPFVSPAVISGSQSLCQGNTSTYNITGIGTGNTVIWSSSDTAVATISNPTQSQVTLSTPITQGSVTLKALITNSCGQTATKEFAVTVGSPPALFTPIGATYDWVCANSGSFTMYVDPAISATSYYWVVTRDTSEFPLVCPTVGAQSAKFTGTDVAYGTDSNGAYYTSKTSSTPYATINWGTCLTYYNIACYALNDCGSTLAYLIKSTTVGRPASNPCTHKAASLKVAPNPVKSGETNFVVSKTRDYSPCNLPPRGEGNDPILILPSHDYGKASVKIYDFEGNEVYSQSFETPQYIEVKELPKEDESNPDELRKYEELNHFNIQNLNLLPGKYVIKVYDDEDKVTSEQLVIE